MITLKEQHQKASAVTPGGVHSSVRIHNAIGTPVYVSGASGAYITSIEGKQYLDMCCAHGAGLLGHGHPHLARNMEIARDMGYDAAAFETVYHEELARKLCGAVPCADKLRFVNSGSEATLHLIRVCRGFTGKTKIVRVEGHFHGYHEMIYVGGQVPPEAMPFNREHPYLESAGMPGEVASLVLPVPFNDTAVFDRVVEAHRDEIAMVILEPVNYNSGGIQPQPGYLEHLREVTRREGILLFFDEVQSSFKNSLGGAQADFGVIPDVCSIGKAIGGGLPLSAFCGRGEIMDVVKPVGEVQHSGTFNAPLINILSGLAFIDEASQDYFYPRLHALGRQLYGGMERIIEETGANMYLAHHGARFNILLGRKTPPVRYEDTFCHDRKAMIRLCGKMLEQGIYLHDYNGGCAHHGYSIQHTEEDISRFLSAFETAVEALRREGLV